MKTPLPLWAKQLRAITPFCPTCKCRVKSVYLGKATLEDVRAHPVVATLCYKYKCLGCGHIHFSTKPPEPKPWSVS